MSRADFMNTTGQILYGSNTKKSYSTFDVLKSALSGVGVGTAICGSLALIMVGQDQALRHFADLESNATFAYSAATIIGALALAWSFKKFAQLTDSKMATAMAGIVMVGSAYLAITSDAVQNLAKPSPTGEEKIISTATKWQPSLMR